MSGFLSRVNAKDTKEWENMNNELENNPDFTYTQAIERTKILLDFS